MRSATPTAQFRILCWNRHSQQERSKQITGVLEQLAQTIGALNKRHIRIRYSKSKRGITSTLSIKLKREWNSLATAEHK